MVFDEEFNTLSIRAYLKFENIEAHFTTSYIKTGNSDIERVHGTINEHVRLFNAKKENISLREKVIIAVEIYNHTIHNTTNKRPIDFIKNQVKLKELDETAQNILETKTKKIEKLNKNRKEFSEPEINNEVYVQAAVQRIQKKLGPKYIKTKIHKNYNNFYYNKRKIHKQQFKENINT